MIDACICWIFLRGLLPPLGRSKTEIYTCIQTKRPGKRERKRQREKGLKSLVALSPSSARFVLSICIIFIMH